MPSRRAGAKNLGQMRYRNAAGVAATTPNTPRSFADAIHTQITSIGTSDWIEVYRRGNGEQDFVVIVSVLVPENETGRLLSKSDWGVDPQFLRPGCTAYADGSVTYDRYGTSEGFEPLVIERDFSGLKAADVEVQEEFRLFHNLYFDQKNSKFVKINKDGSEQEVIRLATAQVSIRALEVKQFLAAKKMQLAVQFDIRRGYSATLEELKSEEEYEDVKGADFRYRRAIARDASDNGCFVRVHGKKLIVGFDLKDSGIWPFSETTGIRAYPSFIVGADVRGKEVLLPCDPHGGNYLQPVFFRSEVLNRYYDNPSKYSVEDGYLRCGGLWGVQIDNDNPDYVAVFLGDIGRDIPDGEWTHWRTFNIVPLGPMSETALRRSFMAEFADPARRDLLFKQRFQRFQITWERNHGWLLFKPLSEADKHCLTSLRIPATDEQNEFDAQAMYLTKILVDSLNENEIAKQIPSVRDQKGISKLESFLAMKNLPDLEQHVGFLRDLQSLRSAGAAHRKSDNYKKIAAKLGLNQRSSRAVFEDLLDRAIQLLNALFAV